MSRRCTISPSASSDRKALPKEVKCRKRVSSREGGVEHKAESYSDECFKSIVETRRQHKATTGLYHRHERVCRGQRPKEVELELVLLKAELVGIVRVGRGPKQLEPRAQLIVLYTD